MFCTQLVPQQSSSGPSPMRPRYTGASYSRLTKLGFVDATARCQTTTVPTQLPTLRGSTSHDDCVVATTRSQERGSVAAALGATPNHCSAAAARSSTAQNRIRGSLWSYAACPFE